MNKIHPLDEGLPVLFHTMDPQGRLTGASGFWLKFLGFEPEELVGFKFLDLLSESCRDSFEAMLSNRPLDGRVIQNVPCVLRARDGSSREALYSAVAEFDSCGNVTGSTGMFFDRTGQVEAERLLTEKSNLSPTRPSS